MENLINCQRERQDRPPRNGSHSYFEIKDGTELQKFVLDVLSLGQKHPMRDKFNAVHLLADVEKFVRQLRENRKEGEELCGI